PAVLSAGPPAGRPGRLLRPLREPLRLQDLRRAVRDPSPPGLTPVAEPRVDAPGRLGLPAVLAGRRRDAGRRARRLATVRSDRDACPAHRRDSRRRAPAQYRPLLRAPALRPRPSRR